MVPLDRILSETDAPYVAPVPYRGKRNEPAYVIEVVKKLADLKQISVEVMAGRILKNARRIFGIEI
jgi:TatD DNase family protein